MICQAESNHDNENIRNTPKCSLPDRHTETTPEERGFGSRSGPLSTRRNALGSTRDPVVGPNGVIRTCENPGTSSLQGALSAFLVENRATRRPGLLCREGRRGEPAHERARFKELTAQQVKELKGEYPAKTNASGEVHQGRPFEAVTTNLGPPRPRQTA